MPATSTVPPQTFDRNLTDSGLRNTPQREIIYDSLLQKRDHPTADEVYARVKSNFERGPTRYCPNLRPHAHFHDEAAGSTHDIDLPEGLLDQVKSILPPGYDASSIEISFRGHSPKHEES